VPVQLRVEVDEERLYFGYRVDGGAWQWLPQQFDASILSDEANAPGSPTSPALPVGMACQIWPAPHCTPTSIISSTANGLTPSIRRRLVIVSCPVRFVFV
jgi:hypothetical protein